MKNTDKHGQTRTKKDEHSRVRESLHAQRSLGEVGCPSVFVANGALSLLNLCQYLLAQQMNAQAEAFEKNGGFTERIYRHHMAHRTKGTR